MTTPARVVAEPKPDEIKAAAQRLNERFQDLTANDARMFAATIMLGDERVERMLGHIGGLEAQIDVLAAEVREWLCPGCRTVYPEPPGPKDSLILMLQCPNCGSVVGLANSVLLHEEKEQRAAERANMQSQINALHEVAQMASQRFMHIAEAETAFLKKVAETAHYTHDPPAPWQQCTREPCVMIQAAIGDHTVEQERIKKMYEEATRA
jgi:hypothetical protein